MSVRVVYAGDEQVITSWAEVLEAADLPPTMIIGAHRVEDETLRPAACALRRRASRYRAALLVFILLPPLLLTVFLGGER